MLLLRGLAIVVVSQRILTVGKVTVTYRSGTSARYQSVIGV